MRTNYIITLVFIFLVVGLGFLYMPVVGVCLLASAGLAVVCTSNLRG
jgi:hypothetical protein